MRRVPFTQISYEDLTSIVHLEDQGIRRQPWDELTQVTLTEGELRQIDYVVAGLRRFKPSVVNEATVWGRAIFPLLLLAETEETQYAVLVALLDLCMEQTSAKGLPPAPSPPGSSRTRSSRSTGPTKVSSATKKFTVGRAGLCPSYLTPCPGVAVNAQP